MGNKLAALILSIYLITLLFVNAMLLEDHIFIVCFDIGTAAIIGAAVMIGDSDGRA